MNKERLFSKIKTDILGIISIFSFAFVLLYPSLCKDAVFYGLSLSWGFLIPSLFFQMVLSGIIKESAFLRRLPFINSRWEIIILSLIGGFPVCAVQSKKAVINGEISESEAILLNNCFLCGGPAFIIGGIGAKLLKSPFLGMLLYISSVLSCFILYLFSKKDKKTLKKSPAFPSFSQCITVPVSDTSRAAITLSAFVTLFSAICYILSSLKIMPYLAYFLEVTFAANSLSESFNLYSLLAIAFFSSFGGLCVQLQVIFNLGDIPLKKGKYFLLRISSGILSAIIFRLFLIIFPQSISVSFIPMPAPDFSGNIPASLFLIIFAFFTAFSLEKINLKNRNYH
ncbi:MAG: hypothetical protein J6K88_03920 [Oscillospiraceae bacterium]|nr:hypothetical protein [Oscillospiraceae bacterium]